MKAVTKNERPRREEAAAAAAAAATATDSVDVVEETSPIALFLDTVHPGYGRFSPCFEDFGVTTMASVRFELARADTDGLFDQLRAAPHCATPLELNKIALALETERRTHNPGSWAELSPPHPDAEATATVVVTSTDSDLSRNSSWAAVVGVGFHAPVTIAGEPKHLTGQVEVAVVVAGPESDDASQYKVCGTHDDGHATGFVTVAAAGPASAGASGLALTGGSRMRENMKVSLAKLSVAAQNAQTALNAMCASAIKATVDHSELASTGRYIERQTKHGTLSRQAVQKLRGLYASHKLELDARLEPTEKEDIGKKVWSLFSSKKERDPTKDPGGSGYAGGDGGDARTPGKIGAYLDMSLAYPSTIAMFASPFVAPAPTEPVPRRLTPPRLTTDAVDKLNSQTGTTKCQPNFQNRTQNRAEINPSTKGKSWLSSLFGKNDEEAVPWWRQPTMDRPSPVKVQFRTTVDICDSKSEMTSPSVNDSFESKGLELGFLFNPLYVDTSATSSPPRDHTEGADEPGSADEIAADGGSNPVVSTSLAVEVWKKAALNRGAGDDAEPRSDGPVSSIASASSEPGGPVADTAAASSAAVAADKKDKSSATFSCPACGNSSKWDFQTQQAKLCSACDLQDETSLTGILMKMPHTPPRKLLKRWFDDDDINDSPSDFRFADERRTERTASFVANGDPPKLLFDDETPTPTPPDSHRKPFRGIDDNETPSSSNDIMGLDRTKPNGLESAGGGVRIPSRILFP